MTDALEQIKRPHSRQQRHVEFADDPPLSRAPCFVVDRDGCAGGFGAGDFELVDVLRAGVFGFLVGERRGAAIAVAGEGGETHCCGSFVRLLRGGREQKLLKERTTDWVCDMVLYLTLALLLLLRTADYIPPR